jgi:putative nucleotidyltransferase with HDIG domain
MERGKALEFLKKNLKNQNLIKHSLAVEAGMRGLAGYFGEDVAKWGTCGLLHDTDYEKTKGDPNSHSKVGSEMLRNLGTEEEICQAVLTHNEAHSILPETKMAKALFCLDPLTGLIVASTLVLPTKKINDLKVENVLNRFEEKAFARGANREIIGKCQEYLGLSIEKFVEISLKVMQNISADLGL